MFSLLLLALAVFAGIASAQSFKTATSYTVGANPNFGTAGDFNEDGKPDLAIGNVLGTSVSVLLNKGDGTFNDAVFYTVDAHPEAVATADLNNDGRLDLAVGNFFGGATSAGNISILLGNGDGTFQAAVNYDAGSPYNIKVADLNGDGKLDLVAAGWVIDKVSVLLGNGNGTFQSAVTYDTGTQPRGVAVADFNGDGKPLAVTNTSSSDTSILLSNGDGTFQAAVNLSTASGPIGISASDLNGDGKQDLVIAAVFSDAVLVLLGNGNGTFQAPVSYPVGNQPQRLDLADFNGDGKTDVVVVNSNSSSFSVLRGNGNGTFQASVTSAAKHNSLTPIASDFDADGKPDLAIVNNGFGLVDVLLNSPSAHSVAISATAGSSATVLVATFVDYDASKTAATFTATIDWDDSSGPTWGTISSNGSGGFNVNGTHTYAAAGTYSVNVQIADTSGNFATVTDTATVKANQTITFGALSGKTFGDPDFSVSATASSSLSVSFAASGQCTVTGTSVHLTGAGSCTITAKQAGDANYNAAADVPQSFNIANAATATAVSSSVNPSEFGQSVTFTATVTSGAGTPTGTVQFKDGGVSIGSPPTLNAGGVAQLTTSALTSGTHTITADYSGDANFLTSSGTLSGGQVVKTQPTLSINDVTIAEGNSGTTSFVFTVTLSAASNLTVTTNYATTDGTATLAGNDYQSASGTLTFNPGDITKTITVNVNGDTANESNETFFVDLTVPVNAQISDTRGVGTILNDDAPTIQFSAADYLVNESTPRITITLNRSGDTSSGASVDYKTIDDPAAVRCDDQVNNHGAAYARCDYATSIDTVNFAREKRRRYSRFRS